MLKSLNVRNEKHLIDIFHSHLQSNKIANDKDEAKFLI